MGEQAQLFRDLGQLLLNELRDAISWRLENSQEAEDDPSDLEL